MESSETGLPLLSVGLDERAALCLTANLVYFTYISLAYLLGLVSAYRARGVGSCARSVAEGATNLAERARADPMGRLSW